MALIYFDSAFCYSTGFQKMTTSEKNVIKVVDSDTQVLLATDVQLDLAPLVGYVSQKPYMAGSSTVLPEESTAVSRFLSPKETMRSVSNSHRFLA